MHLGDRVALVTGGASGIGRATAAALAQEGARIVAADVNDAGAQGTIRALDQDAIAVVLDVSDEKHWIAAIAETIEKFGRLDILVNCAGIGVSGSIEDLDVEDWNRLLAVNLTGTFLGCKHAIPAMREAGNGGSIINISSIAGLVGGEDIVAYSASKGGVTMLTKSIALHCAQHAPGIRCNSIHPTYVDSEMLDPIAEMFSSRAEMLAGMAELVPAGRVATPQDIADVIVFLASDGSRMMTGSQVVVDGGQLAGLPSRHSG